MDHNAFFKTTFQNPDNAIDFLQQQIPKELLKVIQLDTLEIAKDSFIDTNYRDIHSDMLFKVAKLNAGEATNAPCYIYLLLEHKSYPDKDTAFQLHKYLQGIFSLYKQNNKDDELLPAIIPMLLYHGKENWSYSTEFLNYQQIIPGWQNYQVNFSFLLYDLSAIPDEEIKGELITRLFIRLVKYINRDDFEQQLDHLITLLSELEKKETGLEYIETAFLYMLKNANEIDIDSLNTMVENKNRSVQKMLVSVYDKIEEKGYLRALELIEATKRRAEIAESERKRAVDEKRRVEDERIRVELKAKRAERKNTLRTAISMKQKALDLPLIASITKLEPVFLERLFARLGM